MKNPACRLLTLAAVIAAIGSLPLTATAQDLQYRTTTKFELPGAAGGVANFVSRLAGSSNESAETVYVKGNRMRTDDESSSTILDLEQNRFVLLNHDQKFYTVMAFADMAQMAEEARDRAEEAIAEARTETASTSSADARRDLEDVNASVEYDVKVERTGESKSIRGHRAERVLLIMTARGKQVAEREDEEDLEGALVLANEMWLTTDTGGELAPLFSLQEQMSAQMASSFDDMQAGSASMAEGFQAAFASDPRMSEMLANAAEEMSKMDGFPLVSVMKMVIVPGGMTFDPGVAFGGETEQKEEVSTGRRAGRLARGLLRNRLGRGSNDEQPEEEAPSEPKQMTLMSVTTEVTDVQRSVLSDDLFAIPSDYQERSLTSMYE